MPDSNEHRSASDSRERETSLPELWTILHRQKWVVLGVTFATIAVVGIASLLWRPVFESEAVVRIRTEEPGGGLLTSLGPLAELGTLSEFGEQEMDTEIGVLLSRRLAAEVADSVGLFVEIRKPADQPGRRFLQVRQLERDTLSGTFILRRIEGDRFSISPSLLTFDRPPLPTRVRAGEPFQIGNTELTLDASLAANGPDEIRFRLRSFQNLLQQMEKRLKVDTQEGGSQLIEVRYRHPDPVIAAAAVNVLVGRYIAFKDETDRSRSRFTIDTLRVQVAEYQRQLREAEARLRTFQEQELVIAPEEEAEQQIARMAEVQVERDALVVERAAVANLLSDVSAATHIDGEPSPYRRLATYPSFITNGAVQDVLRALLDLENRRADLLARRTTENLDVRTIDGRIAALEDQLYRIANNYLQSLDTQLASVEAVLSGFAQEVERVPARAIEYARLMREAELLGEVYTGVQARLEEAVVEDAAAPPDVQVIDYGLVAEEPVYPKPLVNLLLASVLGLLLGVSVVVGREMTGTQIRSRADAEEAAAGLPVLGMVPVSEVPAANLNGNGRRRAIRVPWIPATSTADDDSLAALGSAGDATAEAYRTLVTNLALASPDGEAAVIAVTSARSSDANPRVVANLAVAFARYGARTLIVDACGPKGAQHRLFGVAGEPGLQEVIAGTSTVEEAVRQVALNATGETIDVLPRGFSPTGSARILDQTSIARIIADMRDRYDQILFDAPPLSASADASLIGRITDTTLLLARSGATNREDLESAARQLRRVGVDVRGIVLGDSEMDLRDGSPSLYPRWNRLRV